MDFRLAALRGWLGARFPENPFTLAPASEDASFRRYWRLGFADGRTLIAMDAPPDKESCGPFLHVAEVFAAAGVHVPAIHAHDRENGFLLLEDLGTTTYLDRLRGGGAKDLYAAATDALVSIQRASRPGVLPGYDRALLERELRLFPDWYLARELRRPLVAEEARVLESAFDAILANNLAQPAVYVHRDYHSRNLMVCEHPPGVLDFQDAVFGPITYDLVSLLRDAYIDWEEEQVLDWVIRYWEKARKAGLPVHADFADFYRDFEWMGVQRQIKVVGIFARLCHRDGKARYLEDIPRVLGYLRAACRRYRELGALAQLLDALQTG
jgi:aminoglycoside/choline kinase family phosphotransferase